MPERGEELGGPQEDIPLTHIAEPSQTATPAESIAASTMPLLNAEQGVDEPQVPARAQDPTYISGTGGPPIYHPGTVLSHAESRRTLRQTDLPLTRGQKWATTISARIDIFTYLTILGLVGLPVLFIADYAMPAQLALNILAYFLALELPPLWRRFLHPALVSSVITICGIYILAICHGDNFAEGLNAYQTKTRYQQLFAGKQDLPKPGAGDLLSSVLDVSIVALALPMYQYRQELKRSVSVLSRCIYLDLLKRSSSSQSSSRQSA
jgi:hypothetical protein